MIFTEPLADYFELLADTLVFDEFEIYGVPVFSTTILYKGEESMYEVERQNFAFQVMTVDVVENEIKEGMIFTLSDAVYTFSFTISQSIVHDLTGVSRLTVDYLGKVVI
jgi:hypothetical protein